MRVRMATDIGGTFTDLVALDEESGKITPAKAKVLRRTLRSVRCRHPRRMTAMSIPMNRMSPGKPISAAICAKALCESRKLACSSPRSVCAWLLTTDADSI